MSGNRAEKVKTPASFAPADFQKPRESASAASGAAGKTAEF
jgi:hypothetical protein